MLEQKREKVKTFFEKADKALEEGRISKKERDAFLEHHCNTSNRHEALGILVEKISKDGDGVRFAHQSASLIAIFFFVMVSMFAVLFYSTGGITGAVVLNISVNQVYTADANIPVVLNGTTDVYVAGNVMGAGDVIITLEHAGNSYELYRYENGPVVMPHSSLPKRQYLLGEDVIYNGTNVSSAYLMTDTDAILLGNNTNITNLTTGSYTISLFINDTNLTQEQLDFTIVDILVEDTVTFDACGTACNVDLTGNGTINIMVTGAELTLTQIRIESQKNRAPAFIAPVTDIVATDTVLLDLNNVFTEPDGDTLFFSSSNFDENDETIENGILTILGTPGTYSYVVYASDLVELTSSNMFTVTFTGGVISNSTNVSVQNITNQTNRTVPVILPPVLNITPVNQSNITSTVLDCSNPDPNMRPLDCLNIEASTYFEEDIILENIAREGVARITPIGNLLITGRVIENSLGTPEKNVFTVSKKENFNTLTVAWIDRQGNFHIKGVLHEEENHLVPLRGSYSAMNRRGVYMMFIDRQTGDLYIRGNVIPYRGSLE